MMAAVPVLGFVTATLVLSCILHSALASTPTAEFYQDISEQPRTTYQCYRNATTLESPTAVNVSVVWNGTGLPLNSANDILSYVDNATGDETSKDIFTTYFPGNDTATLYGSEDVDIRLLSYNGQAFAVNEVVTHTGASSLKIYDMSDDCHNGEALLHEVCPDGCGLQYVRI